MTNEQEKAIKNIETLSEYSLCYTITEKNQEDMKIILDMLKEQEKQISELEKHQKEFYNGELYTAKQLKQIEDNQNKYFINKQKVKDKIKELNDNKGYLKKFRDWTEKEYTNEDIIQNCIEVLEELLEDN